MRFFSESFKNCKIIKKNSLFWKRLETIQNKVKTILNFRNKRKINAIILNISEWYVIKWIYYEMISKYDSLVLCYKCSQNNLFPFYSEIIRKNFRIKWKKLFWNIKCFGKNWKSNITNYRINELKRRLFWKTNELFRINWKQLFILKTKKKSE